MEYVIRRKDYDRVQAKVEGYIPVYGNFNDFFGEIKGYINRTGFVNNLEYKNHTIFIEKYDFFGGFLYTDSYVLDGLLESDSRFMEGLNDLIAYYNSKKDTLKSDVERIRNNQRIYNEASSHARRLLDDYCNGRELTFPENKELLERVYTLYKHEAPEIFYYTTCTIEGDYYEVPTVKLSDSKINILKTLTGVTGASCACLGAISLSAISSPITLIGCVASGVGAYFANKTRKEINEKTLKEKAKDITAILEEKCSSSGEDCKVYSKGEKK